MKMTTDPNFFLVGAARAGTTSLWHYLRAHPDVYMPAALQGKEPSFFCDLTPPWAREYRTLEAYRALFDGAGRRHAIGDASTNYLVAPESARRIREQFPDARILILLRNPADRAYSLYRFLCFWGLETVTPFEKALAREADRYGNERFERKWELLYHAFLYYHSGLYSEQIQRYVAAFPRDQIHIVLYDDLKHAPLETVQKVYRFLGVDPDFEPELGVHNQSQFPLSVRLQSLIASRWRGHPLRPSKPMRRRDRLHFPVAFGINMLLGQYRRERLRPDTRRALLERFRPDINRTAALIGRNLDGWLAERSHAAGPEAARAAVQVG
jgi:hypothetical protein